MSDQDFFFDEEEDTKPKKSATKAASGTKAPVSSKPSSAAPAGSFFAQNVSMTVAALMAVIALLLGIIIGIVIPTGTTSVPAVTAPSATSGDTAPTLSDDQLNSGELPAGHPDISGMGGGTATGSAEATAK